MTIVQEFIERNEQLLDKVAEENPNLGGALAEALAVIDFFAKSNNVTFDDKQKESILASEPIVVEAPKEEPTEQVLKNIEEIVSKSQEQPTKWVIEASGANNKYMLIVLGEEADKLGINREILDGQNGNALLVMDKPLSALAAGFRAAWAADLVHSQKQMTQDEIDELLKGEETASASKWVIEGRGTTDLARLLVIGEYADTQGNKNEVVNGLRDDIFLVADNKITIPSNSQDFLQDLVAKQKQMTDAELKDARNRNVKIIIPAPQPNTVIANAPVVPATITTHTPTAQTPVVHASKEFVEDDIIVSAEDLEALKQLEDLEDLGDINLDDLDI